MDAMYTRYFGNEVCYNLKLEAIDNREVLSVKMSDDSLTSMTPPEMYQARYANPYPHGYFLEQH